MKRHLKAAIPALLLLVFGLITSSCANSSDSTHRMGPPGKDRQMDDSVHNRPSAGSTSEGTHRMGPPGKDREMNDSEHNR